MCMLPSQSLAGTVMTFNSFIYQKYSFMNSEANNTSENIEKKESSDIGYQEEELSEEQIDAIIATYRIEKRKQ